MPKQEDYLEQITALLVKYGVRGLTMDQMAARMGVTKRTLYNNFGTKDELLRVVIDYWLSEYRDTVLKISSNSNQNAVTIQIAALEYMSARRDDTSWIMLQSLRENFPEIFHYLQTRMERMMQEFFAMNIPRGRSEGLYRTDFDIDLIATLTFETLDNLRDSWLNVDSDPNKVRRQLVTFLIRGMATEAGNRMLDGELRQVSIKR